MTQEWYVYQDEQQHGPYTWEELWELARSGAVQPDDHVWTEGMGDWKPAGQIPGLAGAPPSATMPPPPPAVGAEARPVAFPQAAAMAPQVGPARPSTWLVIGAVAGVIVLGAGAFGAAYALFLRDRGRAAFSGPTAERPTAPAGTTAPRESTGTEEATEQVVAEADEGTEEPTEEAAEGPTAPESGDNGDQPVGEPTAQPTAESTVQPTAEPTVPPSAEPTGEAEAEQPSPASPTDTPDAGENDEQALRSPTAVVDAFVRLTLGTVPGASVDYDRARALMTVAYAAEFQSSEFVPLTYGIQEGPTSYEIAAEEVSASTANVLVLGYWGADLGRQWRFALQEEAGLWRVADIEVLEDAEPSEQEVESPFWQLNPVVEAFTVYEHGGWELVVSFDPPAEDIGADFRIAYYREDDGSLVYDQESSGVIEAGRTRLTLDSDWTGYDLSAMGFRPGGHRVVTSIDGVELAAGELVVK
jgi:hypothetical protein